MWSSVFFDGGGVNGISYIGALSFLQEIEIQFKNFYGASIGSVFALLSLLGVNPSIEFVSLLKFQPSLKKNYILSLETLTISLKKYIDTNITFIDLYKITNKTLHIFCTDFDTRDSKIFNCFETPNVKVIDTILASCSLPILFQPKTICGKKYIDGIFSEIKLPENCLKIGIQQNEKTLLEKVFEYAKPRVKQKLDIPLKTNISSIDFKVLNNKKEIEKIILLGYNTTRFFFKGISNKKDISSGEQNVSINSDNGL